MEISLYPTAVTFSSKMNPIQPFKMASKWGIITVREATNKEIGQCSFIRQLTKLFCKNFASNTNDPGWILYKKGAIDTRKKIENSSFNYYKNILNKRDKNLTLLIAQDEQNNIRGAALSYPYNDVPTAKNTTLYIDSLAVDKPFRGYGIGKQMLEKILNANKNTFNDVFLAGEKLAKKFYYKMGFKNLDKNSKNQALIENIIGEDRDDYPNYVIFLTKELQTNKKRWYDIAAQHIKALL